MTKPHTFLAGESGESFFTLALEPAKRQVNAFSVVVTRIRLLTYRHRCLAVCSRVRISTDASVYMMKLLYVRQVSMLELVKIS